MFLMTFGRILYRVLFCHIRVRFFQVTVVFVKINSFLPNCCSFYPPNCHSFLPNCCSFFKIVVRSFKLLFVLPIVVRSSQIVVHFSQIVVRYYQMYVVPPLLLLWYSRDSSCGHLIPAGGLDPKMLLPPSPFPPPPSPFHPLPSSQIVAGIFSHSYPLWPSRPLILLRVGNNSLIWLQGSTFRWVKDWVKIRPLAIICTIK